MFHFLLLVIALDISVVQTIPVPDDIFIVSDIAVYDQGLYLLDKESTAVVHIDKQGKEIHSHISKGQGPGEFAIPRSLALTDDGVVVSDMGKLHFFSRELSFLRSVDIPNNPRSMAYHQGKLYLGMTMWPLKEHGVYVFDLEGKQIDSFYRHGIDDELSMPFLEFGQDGKLYILHRVKNQVDIYSSPNETVERFPTVPALNYKEITDDQPFYKKYGMNLAAVKKWKTSWSEPHAIAVFRDQYLVLGFQELDEDLITTNYFIDVYDLKTSEKVVSWKKMNQILLGGGKYLYFSKGIDEDDSEGFYENVLRVCELQP